MNTFCEGEHREESQVHAFQYPQIVFGTPVEPSPSEDGQQEKNERQAWEEGKRQGELCAKRHFDEAIERERVAIVTALDQFRTERGRYYRQVETEVIQLALSIARKILNREAQVDPLMLEGIVRVAIDKIERGTRVSVRVNPEDLPTWKSVVSQGKWGVLLELEGSQAVEKGQCVLQTQLATAELGIEPQLKEIENGLFDLLSKRPQVEE